jgi:hypothetical protein
VIKRVGVVALVVATMAGGACGFAEKKQLADRIRSAPARMDAARTARGNIATSARIIKPKLTAEGYGRALQADGSAALNIDFARRTADAEGVQMMSGPILYVHRQAATEGRKWLKLDFSELYDDRESLQGSAFGTNAILPLFLVDLLHGALTGSVRQLGSDTIDGVATTHYRANFAFDKAFDSAPDSLREGVTAALAVMGTAYDSIAKGEVWLDAEGLPRRMLATVRASKGRNQVIELSFRLDLSDFGAATAVHLPKNGEIERVDSFSELFPVAQR